MRSYYRMLVDHSKARKVPVEITYEEMAVWLVEHGVFSKDGVRDNDKTVDRNEATGPYALWNMQVLTHAENVAKGNVERRTEKYRKNRWVGNATCAMTDVNENPF